MSAYGAGARNFALTSLIFFHVPRRILWPITIGPQDVNTSYIANSDLSSCVSPVEEQIVRSLQMLTESIPSRGLAAKSESERVIVPFDLFGKNADLGRGDCHKTATIRTTIASGGSERQVV